MMRSLIMPNRVFKVVIQLLLSAFYYFVHASLQHDSVNTLLFPANIANLEESSSIFLTYEANGLVCVHSDYFDHNDGMFWCSKPRHGVEDYIIPSMRTPVLSHLEKLHGAHNGKTKSSQTTHPAYQNRILDENILEAAGLFENLPLDMEYDVEFVDPMEEVKWVCSTIVWKCREDMHQDALTPQMEELHIMSKTEANSLSLPRLPESEYNALKDLYYSLGGEHWSPIIPEALYLYYQSYFGYMWNFTGNSSDHNPCVERWMGIVCDCYYGATVHILDDSVNPANYYYYNNLQGPYYLQPSVCHLRKLGLRGFAGTLNGTLPESVRNLTHLTHLHITGGFFNRAGIFGNLPSSLTALANLKVMSLTWNYITSIPEDIGNMTSLIFLSFTLSKLTGTTIPAAIGSLKNLNYFYCSGNLTIYINFFR